MSWYGTAGRARHDNYSTTAMLRERNTRRLDDTLRKALL